MEILELYSVVKGETGTPEYEESVNLLKRRYLKFKKTRLEDIIDDLKAIKTLTRQKIDKESQTIPRWTQSYFYQKIYKFFRYIFVSTYFYLVPFFILVFQTFLLYANEIYT